MAKFTVTLTKEIEVEADSHRAAALAASFLIEGKLIENHSDLEKVFTFDTKLQGAAKPINGSRGTL